MPKIRDVRAAAVAVVRPPAAPVVCLAEDHVQLGAVRYCLCHCARCVDSGTCTCERCDCEPGEDG